MSSRFEFSAYCRHIAVENAKVYGHSVQQMIVDNKHELCPYPSSLFGLRLLLFFGPHEPLDLSQFSGTPFIW